MSESEGVRISLQQVYEEVRSMSDGLGRIESFMEKHIALQEQTNTAIETRLENHGTRLGAHETRLTNLSDRMLSVEGDVKLLKDVNRARDSRRTPWWSWVAGIGGSITGVAGLVGLWLLLDRIAGAYSQVGP